MNSMDGQEALRWFSEAAMTLVNDEAAKWRENGGKVVGYFCSSMPEEIVTAAGAMPLRIRGTGSKGTDLADALRRVRAELSLPGHRGRRDRLLPDQTTARVLRTADGLSRHERDTVARASHRRLRAEQLLGAVRDRRSGRLAGTADRYCGGFARHAVSAGVCVQPHWPLACRAHVAVW